MKIVNLTRLINIFKTRAEKVHKEKETFAPLSVPDEAERRRNTRWPTIYDLSEQRNTRWPTIYDLLEADTEAKVPDEAELRRNAEGFLHPMVEGGRRL